MRACVRACVQVCAGHIRVFGCALLGPVPARYVRHSQICPTKMTQKKPRKIGPTELWMCPTEILKQCKVTKIMSDRSRCVRQQPQHMSDKPRCRPTAKMLLNISSSVGHVLRVFSFVSDISSFVGHILRFFVSFVGHT